MILYREYDPRNGEVTAEQLAQSVGAPGAEIRVRTYAHHLDDKITFKGEEIIPPHELKPRFRVSKVSPDWVRVKRAG